MRTFAIALNTAREAIRNKLLYSHPALRRPGGRGGGALRLGVDRRPDEVRQGLQPDERLALRRRHRRHARREHAPQGDRPEDDLQHPLEAGRALGVHRRQVPRPRRDAVARGRPHDRGAARHRRRVRGPHRLDARARRAADRARADDPGRDRAVRLRRRRHADDRRARDRRRVRRRPLRRLPRLLRRPRPAAGSCAASHAASTGCCRTSTA